jgi:hypothetical protein
MTMVLQRTGDGWRRLTAHCSPKEQYAERPRRE